MNTNYPRTRHPPGLRGRDIGLYYKYHQKRKPQQEKRIDHGPSISLSERTIYLVNSLLEKYNEKSDDSAVSDMFEKRFNDLLGKDFHQFVMSKNPNNLKLKTNTKLNDELRGELRRKSQTEIYKELIDMRKSLPAMRQREMILDTINRNQITLVVGSTGCGKTTQIPQILLDHFIQMNMGSMCQIVCTQPRRISAITVAERVAYERNEKLGKSIGYQIRLQGISPRPNGSILYCTTGTLLRRMETDPLLYGLTHIILDEIHERSVETDILMGLLRKVLPYRNDLKVILMSATISELKFQQYFLGCAKIDISGTLFEVKSMYLEDILQETGFRNFESCKKQTRHGRQMKPDKNQQEFQYMIEPYVRSIRCKYDPHVIDSIRNPHSEDINVQLIEHLVFHICERKPPGAILVFLPGYDKITKVHSALLTSNHFHARRYHIYTLHSSMPTMDQKNVFFPPPNGVRKIILSTNIAETSVTIDDVVYVINSGKMKMNDYDVDQNMQTLGERWITLANAAQRRGRAGRVQPGICYNLYTRAREREMDDVPIPEIVRTKLEGVLLSLKLLHINDVSEFMTTLLDCPNYQAIKNGLDLLKRINALDNDEVITPLGMHLARLPIDPQMGKMILMGALFRCLNPITSIAAAISFKDPFYRPLGKEQLVDAAKKRLSLENRSDHLLMSNVIEKYHTAKSTNKDIQFCYQNFLSHSTLAQLERMKDQFCEALEGASFTESSNPRGEQSNVNSSNITLVRAIIAAGLYPNVSHLKKVKLIKNRVQPLHSMWTPTDRKVKFHPSSVNSSEQSFNSHYFTYYLKQRTSDVFLMDTTMIFPMALIIFGDGINCDVDRNGEHIISVADFFYFKSDSQTNELIMKLRSLLLLLLQKKALHPSPIDFNSRDEILINAITILLTQEESFSDLDLQYNEDDNCE